MAAAQAGNLEIVGKLLSRGADPRLYDEESRGPVIMACRGGHLDVVKV